ncbi:MAG: SAM-dependent methyltransferase [Trebonia sp.]
MAKSAQEAQQSIGDSWSGKVQQQFTLRSREQVARFFAGRDLVEPGLVPAEEWRPEPGTVNEVKSTVWCGAGRKR